MGRKRRKRIKTVEVPGVSGDAVKKPGLLKRWLQQLKQGENVPGSAIGAADILREGRPKSVR